MSSYEIHPAALLFPPMGEKELFDLAQDIKDHGLLEPISLFERKILDGRNRMEACKISSVEPRYSDLTEFILSPVVYVLSKNLHRRQLTVSQRAAIAAEALPMLEQEAKKTQGGASRFGSGPIGQKPRGSSRSIAAKESNVGEGSVGRAARVMREAPEEFAKVKTGEIPVGAAYNALPSVSHKKEETEPEKPPTERGAAIANALKRRMIEGLSTMKGLSRGLSELDIKKLRKQCDEKEIALWSKTAQSISFQVRTFSENLRGKNDSESKEE